MNVFDKDVLGLTVGLVSMVSVQRARNRRSFSVDQHSQVGVFLWINFRSLIGIIVGTFQEL